MKEQQCRKRSVKAVVTTCRMPLMVTNVNRSCAMNKCPEPASICASSRPHPRQHINTIVGTPANQQRQQQTTTTRRWQVCATTTSTTADPKRGKTNPDHQLKTFTAMQHVTKTMGSIEGDSAHRGGLEHNT